jgi:hypothetical protein
MRKMSKPAQILIIVLSVGLSIVAIVSAIEGR